MPGAVPELPHHYHHHRLHQHHNIWRTCVQGNANAPTIRRPVEKFRDNARSIIIWPRRKSAIYETRPRHRVHGEQHLAGKNPARRWFQRSMRAPRIRISTLHNFLRIVNSRERLTEVSFSDHAPLFLASPSLLLWRARQARCRLLQRYVNSHRRYQYTTTNGLPL